MKKQSLTFRWSMAALVFLLASPVLSGHSKEKKSKRLRGGEKGPKHSKVTERGPQGVPSIVEGRLSRVSDDIFDRANHL